MASLRVLVVSALLACVLADTLTEEQVQQKIDASSEACKHENSQSCLRLCQFKHFGVLDKDGRYVESKALESMTVLVFVGLLNQEQAVKIAKTCNSVNEDIKAGCERGAQVFACFDDERFKLTGNRL